MKETLLNEAKKASKNAYVPYSKFQVGASLLTKDGTIYTGCNIENASYGLANCAERTCLFTAYAKGIRKDDIVAFAIYSPCKHLVSPCGACRQVMVELLNANCKVFIGYDDNKNILETSVKELMPYSFTSEDLSDD